MWRIGKVTPKTKNNLIINNQFICQIIYQAKKAKYSSIKLLKTEDLLLFSVLHCCKLNIFNPNPQQRLLLTINTPLKFNCNGTNIRKNTFFGVVLSQVERHS